MKSKKVLNNILNFKFGDRRNYFNVKNNKVKLIIQNIKLAVERYYDENYMGTTSR